MPSYRYGLDADYVAKLTRRRPRPSPVPGNPNSPALVELFNGAEVPNAIALDVHDLTTPVSVELMEAASAVTTIEMTVAGTGGEEPPPATGYIEFTLHRLRAGTATTTHRGAVALPTAGGETLTEADVADLGLFLVDLTTGAETEVARAAVSHVRPRLDGTLTCVLLHFVAGTMSEGATKVYRLRKGERTITALAMPASPTYTRTAAVWDVYPDTVAVPALDILRKSGITGQPFEFPTLAQAAAFDPLFAALDTAYVPNAEAWADHTKVFPGGGWSAENGALSKLIPTTSYWLGRGDGAWQAEVYTQLGFYDTPLHHFHRFLRTGDVLWFKLACAMEWVLLEEGYKTRAPAWFAGEPYYTYGGPYTFYAFTGIDSPITMFTEQFNLHVAGGAGNWWNNANAWSAVPGPIYGQNASTSLRECARLGALIRHCWLAKCTVNVGSLAADVKGVYELWLDRMSETGSTRCYRLSPFGGIYRDKDCPAPSAQPDEMFVNSFMHGLYMWELIEARRTLALTAPRLTKLDAQLAAMVGHLTAYRYFYGNAQYAGFANGWDYSCASYDISVDIILLNHFYAGGFIEHAQRTGSVTSRDIAHKLSATLSTNAAQKYHQYAGGPGYNGPTSPFTTLRKQWNEMSTYLAPFIAMAMES